MGNVDDEGHPAAGVLGPLEVEALDLAGSSKGRVLGEGDPAVASSTTGWSLGGLGLAGGSVLERGSGPRRRVRDRHPRARLDGTAVLTRPQRFGQSSSRSLPSSTRGSVLACAAAIDLVGVPGVVAVAVRVRPANKAGSANVAPQRSRDLASDPGGRPRTRREDFLY